MAAKYRITKNTAPCTLIEVDGTTLDKILKTFDCYTRCGDVDECLLDASVIDAEVFGELRDILGLEAADEEAIPDDGYIVFFRGGFL